MTALADLSEIQRMMDELAALPDPWRALDEVLAEMAPAELAHIRYDWSLWRRQKQTIPQGPWRSYGLCTGVGFGKTRALTEWITAEVMAGRAGRIGFCAQNDKKTIEVMVEGKSGFLAVSPPWFRARFTKGRIEWPNGAVAFPYTPERPGAMRGPEHDLVWMSELTVWPRVTRDEAFGTLQRRCRLGYAKVVWDTNPRRKHPLLRQLFQRWRRDPERHIIVTGSTRENIDNLSIEFVEDQYAELAGTTKGAEELEGRYFDDDEDATFRSEWFDVAPRILPDTFARRILSIDPAITSDKRWSDATGILDMGIGSDGQIYVNRNDSGVHRAEVWPTMVVDAYVSRRCSLIVIETNRGGDSHVALLRVACRDRGLQLVQLGPNEQPERKHGTVYVRPMNSRGQKIIRAEAAAQLMQKGRISFVIGGYRLEEVRDRLIAFDGSEGKPDDEVDAFTQGVHELAELSFDRRDGREAIEEATSAMLELQARIDPSRSLSVPALLPRAYRPGRI